jgi:hypothetical protein
MPRVRIGPALPDREALDAEIGQLRDLDIQRLRSRWHSAFGRPPPPYLSRHLLFRTLAYRLGYAIDQPADRHHEDEGSSLRDLYPRFH